MLCVIDLLFVVIASMRSGDHESIHVACMAPVVDTFEVSEAHRARKSTTYVSA